ncbi:hypothetical protein F4859DRAFT_513648 [Xylaria cf. heliscus]|nr:hypothetical protein F4859DRAFT_513648 [Xylaria cf. heliscus]
MATNLPEILIVGHGDKGFQFNSGGVWRPADTIVDNGMQQGYSVYCQNVLVGSGRLIVHDEIDKETDVLYGGPLSCGWVTNFPADYIPPPDYILHHYLEVKNAFRKEFITWRYHKDAATDDSIASSVGKSIYALAARDPFIQYGLGETDMSRQTDMSQQTEFSVGFNGTSHRLPTITSSWDYYTALLSAGHSIASHSCPPPQRGNDDAASYSSGGTLGRSDGGRYTEALDSKERQRHFRY